MKDIREEANHYWNGAFEYADLPSQYDRDFRKHIAKIESENEQECFEHLQPWLHILEDGIQWLANIAGIFHRKISEGAPDKAQQSIWALISASCAYSVAVRRLVLSGLDTPARSAARSLDEHICTCIALMSDRKLALNFHECKTNEEISAFWYKNLNTTALKKHLNRVERKSGLEMHISHGMRSWRKHEIEMFSQATHPTYLGSALCALTLRARNDDEIGSALLGKASAMSERTLAFACMCIWYFSCYGCMFLFDGTEEHPPLLSATDPDDEMQQMAYFGRDVYQKLIGTYWEHSIYKKENSN